MQVFIIILLNFFMLNAGIICADEVDANSNDVMTKTTEFRAPESDDHQLPLTSQQKDLEQKLYLSSPQQLNDIEKQIAYHIQTNPNDAFSYYLYNHLMIRKFLNDPTRVDLIRKAQRLTEQALELSHSDLYGLISLSSILDILDEDVKAYELLKKQIALEKVKDWRLQFYFAKMSANIDSVETTISEFQKALDYKDANKTIILPYAIAFINTNLDKVSRMKQLKEWSEKYQGEPFIILSYANFLLRNKEYKKAEMQYEKIMDASIEAFINKAILEYLYLDSPKTAEQSLLKAINHLNSNNRQDLKELVYYHLANLYLKKKDFQKAQNHFLNSMMVSSDKENLYKNIYLNFSDEQQPEELAKLTEKINLEIPGRAMFYSYLGKVQSLSLNNHKEAIKSFNSAILLNPFESEYYIDLGISHYKMKNYSDAKEAFKIASELNPTNGTAFYNLACISSIQGKTDEALSSLKQAINLNPSFVDSAKDDSDFVSLKGNQNFIKIINTSEKTEQNYSH